MSSNGTNGGSGMGGMGGMGGLPGANAMGDTLEFVKNLWGAMKIPGMSMPSMSPEDIDKQIADLKAVESWLQVNMNMLRGSIQALEVQSATLAALRSMSQSFAQAATPPSGAEDSPAFESPFAQPAPSASPAAGPAAGERASAGALPEAAAMAAQFANPALWWNAVQEQFSNAVSQAMTPVTSPAPAKKPRKTAAKKTTTSRTAASKTTARKRTSKS